MARFEAPPALCTGGDPCRSSDQALAPRLTVRLPTHHTTRRRVGCVSRSGCVGPCHRHGGAGVGDRTEQVRGSAGGSDVSMRAVTLAFVVGPAETARSRWSATVPIQRAAIGAGSPSPSARHPRLRAVECEDRVAGFMEVATQRAVTVGQLGRLGHACCPGGPLLFHLERTGWAVRGSAHESRRFHVERGEHAAGAAAR